MRSPEDFAATVRARAGVWTPEILNGPYMTHWWDAAMDASFELNATYPDRIDKWTDRLTDKTLTPYTSSDGTAARRTKANFVSFPTRCGLATAQYTPGSSTKLTFATVLTPSAYKVSGGRRTAIWESNGQYDYEGRSYIVSMVDFDYQTYNAGSGLTATPIALNVPQVVMTTVGYDGTSRVEVRVNGNIQTAAGSYNNANTAGAIILGRRDYATVDEFYLGDMGDVVWCWGALGVADRLKLEGYLAHKYGCALTAAHPFANRAPSVYD